MTFIVAAFLACAGCDEDVTETTDGAGGTTSDGGSGPSGPGPTTGVGGGGGAGGFEEYIPTAEDIDFVAHGAVPSGEQILFNDWAVPDTLRSMQTDGSNVVDIFSAYRIWRMSTSRAGTRLAFSVGDSQQEAHFGITIGDAIQHTFIYDFATQTVELLAWGNINDECHHWGPGDTEIYVCRRYDFMPDNTNKTYRLGEITVTDGAFQFLVDEEDLVLTLNPQVTDDGSEL
jgi:hypothetical protein